MASSATPLMKQFLQEKEKYPDSILLFRVGDFYEMFYEDAVIASDALGLVLTSRDKNSKNPIPLCGVPYHALKTYLSRLLDQGFKVAVCEQVENPRTAKGVVKREVVRVITPGLILDEDQLDAKTSNYISALYGDSGSFGYALSDISTGEFKVTELSSWDEVTSELARVRPKQIVTTAYLRDKIESFFPGTGVLFEYIDSAWENISFVKEQLNEFSIEGIPKEYINKNAVLIGAAALIGALQSAQPAEKLPPVRIIPYTPTDFMILDDATISNLELFETIRERKKDGSLISVMDKTITAMGGRLLRTWMLYPLMDIPSINKRHDGVEILIKNEEIRDILRSTLREFPDFERLSSRIVHQLATPRDLGVLLSGIKKLPALGATLDLLSENKKVEILDFGDDFLENILEKLDIALVDEPPVYLKDGGVIRKGFHPELDELIELSTGGKQKILEIEEKEKARTGITSLKIKFNKVFGYYIEIPRSRVDSIPEEYIRKQTLRNSERYVTPELAEHESLVLSAEEKRISLEEKLFLELRTDIAKEYERIHSAGKKIAVIDTLASLAEIAHRRGYIRPKINDSDSIILKSARHPVIETILKSGDFIPNDIKLSSSKKQLSIITGPNMSGKSTIIRQVALGVLMAQMGSFVPADKSAIGICDRIFSRVGASDNIARGESTFMVEMKETANILSYATKKSLVILDEIGRGTSTYDGVSIAWSVVEFLHDIIGCRTLFATHYHELTALSNIKPRVFNSGVSVKEWKGSILFLRKLLPGTVNRSYGIQVAALAGVPHGVISRAKSILKALENGESLIFPGLKKEHENKNQLSLFIGGAPEDIDQLEDESDYDNPPLTKEDEKVVEEYSQVIEKLNETNPDDLSPREALDFLYSLKSLMNK